MSSGLSVLSGLTFTHYNGGEPFSSTCHLIFYILALRYLNLCETSELNVPKSEISRMKKQRNLIRLMNFRKQLLKQQLTQ